MEIELLPEGMVSDLQISERHPHGRISPLSATALQVGACASACLGNANGYGSEETRQ